MTATDADLDAARDLIQRSEIKAVEYHELAARWTGRRDPDSAAEADVDLDVQYRAATHGDNEFGFRLIGNVRTHFGEANATVAITYTFEGDPPPLRTLLVFGNDVAILACFPYFREALGTITGKVFGDPFTLPILERGQLAFSIEEEQAALEE